MGCNWSKDKKEKSSPNENVEKISKSISNVAKMTTVTKANESMDEDSKGPENGSAKSTNGVTIRSSFLGNGHNAKVSPMIDKGNLPKPVAFEVGLDGNQEGESSDAVSSNNVKPRKLPKLTPMNSKTQEELINKQKKAEEKRQEILESRKQKARKFLNKYDQNESSSESENIHASQDSAEDFLKQEIDNLKDLMGDEQEALATGASTSSKMDEAASEMPVVIADRNI